MPAVTFTTGGALRKSALRQANERLVLNSIRQNPGVSRADIARITSLSPSSVTFIVKRLKREKLVCEQKTTAQAQVGRQPTALRLSRDARRTIGVDITLSGARVVLTDLDGTVLRQKAVAWHPNSSIFFNKTHAAIRSLADPLPAGQLLGAGVALPGFIDRNTGRVVAAENFNWFDVDAGEHLRRNLPFPFYFENTAKLSALAELWAADIEARPLRDFVSITAHSGLGTGVIIQGQILQGATAAASEFGHTVLHPQGRRCRCGNSGCWEQYASDLALCRRYVEEGGSSGGPASKLEAEAVVKKAREGDAIALRVLHETARDVGLGFASIIVVINPEAIIVGDYLAEAWDLIEETVWSAVRGAAPAYFLNGLRMEPSRHKTDTSLMGAVALVLTRFFNSFDHDSRATPSSSVSIRASA